MKKRIEFLFLFMIVLIFVLGNFQTRSIKQYGSQLISTVSNNSQQIPKIAIQMGWPANGSLFCNNGGYTEVITSMISDGYGGTIMAWFDSRTASTSIYVQRIDAAGIPQWGITGLVIGYEVASQGLSMISDGQGGAIITWQDQRGGNPEPHIYAQWINASGVPQWTANGVVICNASSVQLGPVLVSDGLGGAIIAWQDSRNTTSYHIYAQRINATGVCQWIANGTVICNAGGSDGQYQPEIISDGSYGAIISWRDTRNLSPFNVYAQRVDSLGDTMWNANGTVICNASGGTKGYNVIIGDGSGGAIIAWSDYRNGDNYAQRINSAGTTQWTANGTALSGLINNQVGETTIVSDNVGGAIIAWRCADLSGYDDIYAQRINGSGANLWTTNGTLICNDTNIPAGEDTYQQITNDNANGAIFTWNDYRNGANYDIYAQRVNLNGIAKWTPNGVVICNAVNDQTNPYIVSDNAGGAFIAWIDYRNTPLYSLTYAQHVCDSLPFATHSPATITTTLNSTETIQWTLQDDQGAGMYEVFITDSSGNSNLWVNWNSWKPNVSITVPINRTEIGTFNYTIQYTDDQNVVGIPDTVVVTIGNLAITGPVNLNVTAGTSGNVLQWSIMDGFSNTPQYYIIQNGTIIQQGTWNTNFPLPYSLDNLAPGVYNFTLIAVEAGGAYAQFSTLVTVLNNSTTTSSSIFMSFLSSLANYQVLIAAVIGVFLIAVLLILMRMQSNLTNLRKELLKKETAETLPPNKNMNESDEESQS